MTVVASVVIPAYNEERSIGRQLHALRSGLESADLEVIVACNGCTDATAAVARSHDPAATVLEFAQPSKARAVRGANEVAGTYPRVHVDADVELDGRSVRALVAALEEPGVQAVAPRRLIPREGCSPPVRWYYDVWEQLPAVRRGLFGRGAFVLSEAGQQRVSALPEVMGDDLAVSEAFTDSERRIVEEATVVVRPPRTVADLVRRRIRVATGNAQGTEMGVRRPGAATSWGDLARLARDNPRVTLKIPAFLVVTLASRVLANRAVRAGDFATWQRDESSRA